LKKECEKVFLKKTPKTSLPPLLSFPAQPAFSPSWPIFSFSFSQPEADQSTSLLSLARATQLARAARRAELPAQLSLFLFFSFFLFAR
jgi:hypothetical protein